MIKNIINKTHHHTNVENEIAASFSKAPDVSNLRHSLRVNFILKRNNVTASIIINKSIENHTILEISLIIIFLAV